MSSVSIESIIEEWKQDSRIDQTRLNEEYTKTPELHSKYLGYFVLFRAKRTAVQSRINRLKNVKRRYYRGELSQHELKERGWEQWQGLKPSMTELKELYDQDDDLIDLTEKLSYFDTALYQVESILRNINSRGYDLRALLDLRKFEAGI